MTDTTSIALRTVNTAAQILRAWEAEKFEQITAKRAQYEGFDTEGRDPKWLETDLDSGWFVQALTNGEGGIECYLFPKDDEPVIFTLDPETGAIALG